MYFSKATVQITHLGRSLFLCYWFRRSALRATSQFLASFLLLFTSASSVFAEGTISLEVDQAKATAGYYQLSWGNNDDVTSIYIVEESSPGNEKTVQIYQGTDTATVISGKPDGVYSYQVRTVDGKRTSNPLSVTVAHHSLTTAFNFFWVGAVVFIFILAAILRGNQQLAGQL